MYFNRNSFWSFGILSVGFCLIVVCKTFRHVLFKFNILFTPTNQQSFTFSMFTLLWRFRFWLTDLRLRLSSNSLMTTPEDGTFNNFSISRRSSSFFCKTASETITSIAYMYTIFLYVVVTDKNLDKCISSVIRLRGSPISVPLHWSSFFGSQYTKAQMSSLPWPKSANHTL